MFATDSRSKVLLHLVHVFPLDSHHILTMYISIQHYPFFFFFLAAMLITAPRRGPNLSLIYTIRSIFFMQIYILGESLEIFVGPSRISRISQ